MAIIPNDEQFIGLSASVDTTERRSALINAESQAYTMQDIIDTVPGGLEGTQYVFVMANGTDVENAAELQAAYTTAQTMSAGSSNRITVIAAPANYNFSSNFVMGAEFVDLVSLDGNRSIVFNGTATIQITANDVFVKGVDVLSKTFLIGNALSSLRLENCNGGDNSFGGSLNASGTFTNCSGGQYSFGGIGTASGVFTDCVANGPYSFGGSGTASGTFTNCISNSFGAFGNTGTASGIFINCISGSLSFGGGFNPVSGTFTDCVSGAYSFGRQSPTDGVFTNCKGGIESFGASNNASGVFTDCVGGDNSFGFSADGEFIRCISGINSFGLYDANGKLTDCVGGSGSFGSLSALTGKLYYCRLTSGTFNTVSGGGRTVLCIDGNNNQNNQ